MIEYVATKKEVVTRDKFVVDGDACGEIWTTEHGFQCQISVDEMFGTARFLTLNGCGKTRDLALINAIKNGRDEAMYLAHAADHLEQELGAEK
jgi:hypothetical protein